MNFSLIRLESSRLISEVRVNEDQNDYDNCHASIGVSG